QLFLLLLLLPSCGGGGSRSEVEHVQPGLPVSVEVLEAEPGTLRLAAENIPAAGLVISLELPGAGITDGIFLSSTAELLALADVHGGSMDLSIAPLSGGIRETRIQLSGLPAPRDPSILALDNRVTDFIVSPAPDNNLQLNWTAVNLGDYDHNGEVNVADLIPLALYFGESMDGSEAWSRFNPRYWVDGDGNGELNLADITTIARNFGNTIDHFRLYADGDLLQQIPFSEGVREQGSGLPARFELLVSAESVSSAAALSIVTVDREGNPGGPESGQAVSSDLSVSTQFLDLPLLELCGKATNSAFQPTDPDSYDCYSVMRLINPIDDPGSHKYSVDFPLPFGSAMFDEVHRDKLCYLQTSFLPAVNPASGDANQPGGPDGPDVITLAFPFKLADDGRSYGIQQSIRSVPGAQNVSYLDYHVTSGIPGQPVAGALRLNPAAHSVARDLDGDGDYTEESWLQDSDNNGLSDALEERLRTDELYHADDDVTIVATVEDIHRDSGLLQLRDAYKYDDSGDAELGDVDVWFTELTRFENANPLSQGPALGRISSAVIEPGRQLTLHCRMQRLSEFGEVARIWTTQVSQLEQFGADNSLYVVPALTERRPGQIVNVTVYANASAEPFNTLDKVTLHVLGSAEIVEGSINPGVQGGADDEPDGIWKNLGPGPLAMEASDYPVHYFAGRYFQNMDVGITPASSLNLSNASGALFNFDLRIYEPVVVLAGYRYKTPVARYKDAQGNSYDWTAPEYDDAIQISLLAPLPKLLLFDTPLSGDGSFDDPYIIEAGTRYRLQVLDEIDLDITENPNTWYVVDPPEAGYIDYTDPVIEINPGYEGFVSVHILYPGKLEIPGHVADKVYFHTP
ncbi:hypothetical protein KDL44_10915, partial [bacterium]|nr:hypothetical protein [bacterium]